MQNANSQQRITKHSDQDKPDHRIVPQSQNDCRPAEQFWRSRTLLAHDTEIAMTTDELLSNPFRRSDKL